MAATATLFNYSFEVKQPKAQAHVPPSIRKVVVVGGGSAGWMCALTLASALLPKGIEIEVLESPAVGIIGVGEGSTPWLRGFFDSIGIEEAEWMPSCQATYKCGIAFEDWSTKPGFESYFHPFASMLDNMTMTQFVYNVKARLNGVNVHAHPDRQLLSSLRFSPINAWRRNRSATFRSMSGTATTSMRYFSASFCRRRRSSAASGTRRVISSTCNWTKAGISRQC